ncbi:MAG: tyrosine--tRNA ligase [Candidatus Thermoplasmatota archaeon]|nr:tyrosine--tRNA ligase [Candidatus Thermoplasmatota archaeon]
MTKDQKLALITRNVDEILTLEELEKLIEDKTNPRAYVGIEPSGLVHIGQGILCAQKANDLAQAGFEVIILLADWHAFINDKLNGNLENIKICAEYVKDCFLALNVDKERTKFVYVSELVKKESYWERVIRIAKCFSLARMKRAMTIMGRKEEEAELDTSKIIYPAMQCADIFELNVDIAFGGIDQRKAHVLAREAADKLGLNKFVALHTPILPGLQARSKDIIEQKMSKSKPETCIFIHDSKEEITNKILSAYCPPKDINNPVIDICKYLILPAYEKIRFERRDASALEGNLNELLKFYATGELHPLDLKLGVAEKLYELLAPVRKYFSAKPENLERVLEIGRRK